MCFNRTAFDLAKRMECVRLAGAFDCRMVSFAAAVQEGANLFTFCSVISGAFEAGRVLGHQKALASRTHSIRFARSCAGLLVARWKCQWHCVRKTPCGWSLTQPRSDESIGAVFVVVIGWRIVAAGGQIEIRVPVNFNVADVAVDEADYVFSVFSAVFSVRQFLRLVPGPGEQGRGLREEVRFGWLFDRG